jgi:hypothetical protein
MAEPTLVLNGYKEWRVDGKLHRLDGPAIEFTNGSKAWYVDNRLHRLDGPAVEWADGSRQWWVNGERLIQEQFNRYPLVVLYRLSRGAE